MSPADLAEDPVGNGKSANAIDERCELLGRSFSSIGDAVIVTDSLGKVILLNPAAESLTGWTDRDAKNQDIEAIFRIIHEVTRLPVVQPVHQVLEHGNAETLAHLTLLIAKDGTELAIDDSASPIHDQAGVLDGVVLIFRDISDRRRREKGLEATRLRSEVIIETVQDSLIVLDGKLRVRSANLSFYETFRATPEETIGRSLFDLGGGQWNVEGLRAALDGILVRNNSFEEFRIERVFLTIGPKVMLLKARRLHRKTGGEEMILLTIEDVTGLGRPELSLADSELRYRRLFEAAQDGILILNGEDGKITDANPYLLTLLGYTRDDLIGKQLWEIGLLEDEKTSVAYLKELQTKGFIRYEDLPLRTRDGQRVEVEFVSNVYRAGHRTIIQCNIRDISVRKQAEDHLKRAKESAEKASRAKDLFLATLSHELRTPLTPVLATIAYIETRETLPEELREEFATIRRNVELEARLIDDLLDLTRIGQGKLELHREILDVHLVLRTALEVCQSEIEVKKLEVSLALRAKDHLVWGDQSRLRQVFWNLIKNAVKFTPEEGSIRIGSSDTGTGRLAIEISDTGMGIDPEILPRIFDIFDQGDRETARKYGGLGLGLAIAKMVVDLHDGSLTAISDGQGHGSLFRVEMDQIHKTKDLKYQSILAARKIAPEPDLAVDLKDGAIKLLLVEDNPDTLRAISLMLRATGFAVKTAVNVREAMAALNFERFNLLVSDIGLPDGSGLDIMRLGRDTFGLKGIALSGYGTAEDVTASKKAGFAHHLAKPSSINALVDLIRRTAS